MPHDYRIIHPDKTLPRTEEDVPRTSVSTSFSVVEIKGDWIYIMPNIEQNYKSSKIVSALTYATVCKSTRPGKILLGLPDDKDPMRMQVFHCPRQVLDGLINKMDAAEGYEMDPETKELIWTGNEEIPEDERPVSRREGIPFNRRGGISDIDAVFFTTVPIAPVVNEEVWRRQCNDDIKMMAPMREISVDPDFESAKRQHIRCGRLEEPIMSPAWIEKNYKNACREANRVWTADADYPFENETDMEKRMAVWEGTNPQNKLVGSMEAILREEHAQVKPRKAATQQLRIERARLNRLRAEDPTSKRDRIDQAEIARLKAIEHNKAMESAPKKAKVATKKPTKTTKKRAKVSGGEIPQ
jgi:hypothetical protein